MHGKGYVVEKDPDSGELKFNQGNFKNGSLIFPTLVVKQKE